MGSEGAKRTFVRAHIDRCIECYSMVGDDAEELRKKTIDRASYEQMRADLMLLVGMVMAMEAALEPPNGH